MFVYSWSYTAELVSLHLKANNITTDIFGFNDEWSVEDVNVRNYTDTFENQLYDYVTFTFSLKKKMAILPSKCHGTNCIGVYFEYCVLLGTPGVWRKGIFKHYNISNASCVPKHREQCAPRIV